MAGIDSLLKMVRDNAADELRVGTDREPRILKGASPVRLSIPTTSDDFLRIMLEPLFTAELEAKLRAEGRVETTYAVGGDAYNVQLLRRGNPGPSDPLPFDVIFRKGAAVAAPLPAPTAGQAPYKASPVRVMSEAPVAKAQPGELLTLLQRATHAHASDLHLCTGEPPTLRIDGSLRALESGAVQVESLLADYVDEAGWQRVEQGRSVDAIIDAGTAGRFRVNLYRASGRTAAAIRVLPGSAPTLADLNLPPMLEDCVAAPHGLVLVCGATGSGKSATLAALASVALANAAQRGQARMLITLEDPVEYVIDASHGGLVRQRQIGRDVVDFASGLRDALREDPDILLIGEMRDAETIGLAMTAAETGHLVLSSVHTRSAASTVERIVDVYPPGRQQQIRTQLADALRAVVSQRLLRGAHGGRLPAVEILRATSSVQSLIREGKTAHLITAIQSGRKDGMVSLERSLTDLVRAGRVSREEAFRDANDPDTLMQLLGNTA